MNQIDIIQIVRICYLNEKRNVRCRHAYMQSQIYDAWIMNRVRRKLLRDHVYYTKKANYDDRLQGTLNHHRVVLRKWMRLNSSWSYYMYHFAFTCTHQTNHLIFNNLLLGRHHNFDTIYLYKSPQCLKHEGPQDL